MQAADDCTVRVGGHPFKTGSHVKLPSDDLASIQVTAFDARPRYRVELELAGVKTTVGQGRGKEFGWHRNLDVPQYADYGVGTYKLRVVTIVGGQPCTATGLMDITGRAPVTTVAGGLAALDVVVATLLLVLILFRRGGRRLWTRQAFGAEDPLAAFENVGTPGDYVGWAEVACDLGARTFVTTKPDADAVRAFMDDPATHVRLAEIGKRGVRVRAGDTNVVLPRLRWRPRLAFVAPLLGVLAAFGVFVYLQQSAVLYPTRIGAALAVAAGLVGGLVIANFSRFLGKVALNRRLVRAEAGLHEEEVEPRYPPIDHLDELDTFVWTPTHTVPEGGDGLPAWEEADKTKASVATLDPGLPVKVLEQRDGLAQVVCSNGWVGWTDAEPLEEITS